VPGKLTAVFEVEHELFNGILTHRNFGFLSASRGISPTNPDPHELQDSLFYVDHQYRIFLLMNLKGA
jgi:hypothetical protein